MKKTTIASFDLKKSLSQIGGFFSLVLGFYGLFVSFILPKLFIKRLLKVLSKRDNKETIKIDENQMK